MIPDSHSVVHSTPKLSCSKAEFLYLCLPLRTPFAVPNSYAARMAWKVGDSTVACRVRVDATWSHSEVAAGYRSAMAKPVRWMMAERSSWDSVVVSYRCLLDLKNRQFRISVVNKSLDAEKIIKHWYYWYANEFFKWRFYIFDLLFILVLNFHWSLIVAYFANFSNSVRASISETVATFARENLAGKWLEPLANVHRSIAITPLWSLAS